jgi:hypothetical protein
MASRGASSTGRSTPGHPVQPRRRGRVAGAEREILTTPVGLRIPADLSFERWERAGANIGRVFTASAWCLGDWLVYGQERFTDRYRRAVDAVGLDYQTLRNYSWVARAFAIPRRRERLSFQHHAEVAALPPADQDRWLDAAEAGGWSKSQLRAHVRATRPGALRRPDGTLLLPRVRVEVERMEQWRAAATRSRRELDEWVLESLDRAAVAALAQPATGTTGAEPREAG